MALVSAVFETVRAKIQSGGFEGLRPSHLRVISCVSADGTNITELAERVGMTKQGCGQFVSQLTESGHLRVTPDPSDRRGRIVTRTARGRCSVAHFERMLADLERGWQDAVGAERYATFRTVLEELAAGIPEKVDQLE